MFEHPTQHSSIVLGMANVQAIILKTQDDDDPNRKISYNESDDLGESTLPSNIEEDYLDQQH